MAGAEQVAKRRLPVLFAATMAGARELAEAPDSGRATLGLKMRLQKLKESVIKEATAREAEMRDREEAWTLRAALRAVREGDTAAAARHLQERVEHLERLDRERRPFVSELDALYASSSDEEGEEEEEGAREKREADRDRDRQPGDPDAQKENAPIRPAEGKAGGGAPLLSAARAHDLLSPAYWEGVAGGQLAIAASLRPAAFAAGGAGAPPSGLAAHLGTHGYLEAPEHFRRGDMARIMAAVRSVERAGWPPIFAFMFDEPWGLVKGLWAEVEGLLGGECTLEPSFTAFHLDYGRSRAGEKYVGTNFALPHRDYTYADSTFSDGAPKILSVWVPVNDVTTDNRCMYVVPKEYDANFAQDGAYEHMQVMQEGGLKGQQFLHFPLNGVRPLPARSGGVLAWNGNTIHWGASCNAKGATDPRASLAFVFRRADAVSDLEQPCLRRADVERLPLEHRLLLVHQAMGYFRHWYELPRDLSAALKYAERGVDEAGLPSFVPKPSAAGAAREAKKGTRNGGHRRTAGGRDE